MYTRKVYNILTTYSKPYKLSKHIVQHTTYKQVQVSTSTSNLSEDRIRIHSSTSQNIILWENLKRVRATIHRKTSWTRKENVDRGRVGSAILRSPTPTVRLSRNKKSVSLFSQFAQQSIESHATFGHLEWAEKKVGMQKVWASRNGRYLGDLLHNIRQH